LDNGTTSEERLGSDDFSAFLKVDRVVKKVLRFFCWLSALALIIIMMIAVLSLMLEEGYLVDIAIIYAMLSFLAVVVLVKIYIGIYRSQKIEEEKRHD